MRRAAQITVPASGALLLCLSGCGGDRREEAEPPRPSRAQYVSQVNRICDQSERSVRDATHKGMASINRRGLRASEAQAELLQRTTPVAVRYLRQAMGLPRPRQDERRLAIYWRQVAATFPLYPSLADAIRADDQRRIRQIVTRLRTLVLPIRRFSQSYGLTSCLSEPYTVTY